MWVFLFSRLPLLTHAHIISKKMIGVFLSLLTVRQLSGSTFPCVACESQFYEQRHSFESKRGTES